MSSRPIAFKMLDVICDNPIGIITMEAYVKYVPASVLLKIKSHIGSPIDKYNGNRIVENKIVSLTDKFILFFKMVLFFSSPLSISFDCSLIDGMIVTASELMRVEGIIISGKVIPIIIPNSESASDDE